MKAKLLPIFIAALFLGLPRSVWATDPHFSISPRTGTFNQSFNVEIRIDTGGQPAGGADVYLSYPNNLLRAENFTKGTAFPEIYPLIKNEEGRIRIFAYFSIQQSQEFFNGNNGLIGTLRFTPIGTGTAPVNFICTAGETNETNVVEKTTTLDVVVCTANLGGSYQVSGVGPTSTPSLTPSPTGSAAPTATATSTPTPGGAAPTSSPTPTPTSGGGGGATSTPTQTRTPTPTAPITGVVEETIGLLGFGMLILLTGIGLSIIYKQV